MPEVAERMMKTMTNNAKAISTFWDGNPEQSEGDGIKKAETVSRPADGGEQLLIPGFE